MSFKCDNCVRKSRFDLHGCADNCDSVTSTNYLKADGSIIVDIIREPINNLKKSTYISNEGIKHDNGKPDLTDIPLEALWQMGEAFTYGQRKYTKSNFRKGMLASRQLAAAVRHIFQHLAGQTLDAESGVTHLGHALASIAMTCYTLANHPHLDDRFVGDLNKNDNRASKAP